MCHCRARWRRGHWHQLRQLCSLEVNISCSFFMAMALIVRASGDICGFFVHNNSSSCSFILVVIALLEATAVVYDGSCGFFVKCLLHSSCSSKVAVFAVAPVRLWLYSLEVCRGLIGDIHKLGYTLNARDSNTCSLGGDHDFCTSIGTSW